MTKLLAGVFAGFSMLFGGLFGHHAAPAGEMASSSSSHMMGTSTPWGAGGMGSTTPGHMGMMPGVMGTVESVDGTSLTVSGHAGNSATTTYTVDASSAKVMKAASGKMATSSVAAISVGDKVMVQGTVSGTSITAKTIIDGIMGMMMGGKGGPMRPTHPVPSSAQ